MVHWYFFVWGTPSLFHFFSNRQQLISDTVFANECTETCTEHLQKIKQCLEIQNDFCKSQISRLYYCCATCKLILSFCLLMNCHAVAVGSQWNLFPAPLPCHRLWYSDQRWMNSKTSHNTSSISRVSEHTELV